MSYCQKHNMVLLTSQLYSRERQEFDVRIACPMPGCSLSVRGQVAAVRGEPCAAGMRTLQGALRVMAGSESDPTPSNYDLSDMD